MKRILLVEDDPELRLLLEHVLLGAGYEVDTAATVAAANARLDDATPTISSWPTAGWKTAPA